MRMLLSSCSILLACCGGPTSARDAGPPGWHVVLQGLQPALLCVWGTAHDDVFAVGGPRGNLTPSALLHYDGRAWKNLAPGGTDTFWWTHGTSSRDLWLVGENGRITHWDGATFTEHPSGTMATLYGVWAAAANDVWAVGGTPEGGASRPNDVVLHFDGATWSPTPPPQTFGRAFFKVWGAAADNLYIVGEAATIWHRSGSTWALEPNPARSNLTTVAGCSANEVYAVGGRDVLRRDATAWTRLDAPLTNDVNGVSCGSPGNVVVVGSGGLKQRLAGGQWHDDVGAPPYAELHGAWTDPSGAYWAAGGDFLTDARPGGSRQGVIAYFGIAVPASTGLP